MTPVDTILSRIKKLMALAGNNPNPEEAALAAAKVQDLLFAHNLTLAQVDTHQEPSPYEKEEHMLDANRNTVTWKRSLFGVIARENFCKCIYIPGTTKMEIVGQRHNIEVVCYLADHIGREIERLAHHAAKAQLSHKAAYVNSFCQGALNTVYQRLKAQRAENVRASADCTALVVKTDQALGVAFKRYFPKTKSSSSRSSIGSYDGYSHGQKAGHAISLNRGIGATRRDALQ